MRIAQVAPLFESVPPRTYGGTERVVCYLTEELVRLGHDVTLFATGDSKTSARLVPVWKKALRAEGSCVDTLAAHVLLVEQACRKAADFDLLHFHIDYIHFPLTRRLPTPTVTTLHGRLDLPELAPLYREFRDRPVVSISDAQRGPLPFAGWRGTVYHGLPPDLYAPPAEAPGPDWLFMGRIAREKGLEAAIEIARRTGRRLTIAAKVDRADQAYFDHEIRPLLGGDVDFLGEVDESRKGALLGKARALLFPIDWPEPFGLVMIEALACGTPVIALRRGSVPEVIEDGVTGFIVDDVDGAVAAAARVDALDRATIRRRFERRFTAGRMADDYVAIYRKLIERRENGKMPLRPDRRAALASPRDA